VRLKYQRGLCEPSIELVARLANEQKVVASSAQSTVATTAVPGALLGTNIKVAPAEKVLNSNENTNEEVDEEKEEEESQHHRAKKAKVVVVGSGPAGLFAALVLADAGSVAPESFSICMSFWLLLGRSLRIESISLLACLFRFTLYDLLSVCSFFFSFMLRASSIVSLVRLRPHRDGARAASGETGPGHWSLVSAASARPRVELVLRRGEQRIIMAKK